MSALLAHNDSTDTETVKTDLTYKDPDTCGLYESGHEIAAPFDDVLTAFEDSYDDDITVDVVAGGCNTCTRPDSDADVWAYYVAQGSDDTETLFVGYGSTDDCALSSREVGERLLTAAATVGVDAEWDGDTSHKVELIAEN
jgi:hypothetical protein